MIMSYIDDCMLLPFASCKSVLKLVSQIDIVLVLVQNSCHQMPQNALHSVWPVT
jgi:hypothetical protein